MFGTKPEIRYYSTEAGDGRVITTSADPYGDLDGLVRLHYRDVVIEFRNPKQAYDFANQIIRAATWCDQNKEELVAAKLRHASSPGDGAHVRRENDDPDDE